MNCEFPVFNKCLVCSDLLRCKDGQRAVKNHQCPDRDPDALTNDFIYMRGEYDINVKISKKEVKVASDAYRKKIEQIRTELGL